MASDLLKLGGLWKNTDKKGNDYFSGSFTYGTKLLVMKNTYKEKDKDPDYIAYIAPKEDKKGQAETESDVPF